MECTKCNQEESEWDFGDEKFCQMCWEEVCDESWWKLCSPYWKEPNQQETSRTLQGE